MMCLTPKCGLSFIAFLLLGLSRAHDDVGVVQVSVNSDSHKMTFQLEMLQPAEELKKDPIILAEEESGSRADTELDVGEQADGWCGIWDSNALDYDGSDSQTEQQCFDKCLANSECMSAIFESAGEFGNECWLGSLQTTVPGSASGRTSCRNTPGCSTKCFAKTRFLTCDDFALNPEHETANNVCGDGERITSLHGCQEAARCVQTPSGSTLTYRDLSEPDAWAPRGCYAYDPFEKSSNLQYSRRVFLNPFPDRLIDRFPDGRGFNDKVLLCQKPITTTTTTTTTISREPIFSSAGHCGLTYTGAACEEFVKELNDKLGMPNALYCGGWDNSMALSFAGWHPNTDACYDNFMDSCSTDGPCGRVISGLRTLFGWDKVDCNVGWGNNIKMAPIGGSSDCLEGVAAANAWYTNGAAPLLQ